jgi:hypothetical protein
MASLVPESDRLEDDLYFFFCDVGQLGRAFVESSPEDTTREVGSRDIDEGQHERPLRVFALNAAQHWSRDVSREIAQAVIDQGRGRDFPAGTSAFLDAHLGYIHA